MMAKTIRVSEEFHTWVKSHKRDDETMEETLRRLARGPDPSDVAGLLTADEAEELKEAVKGSREGDAERKRAARDAFATDG
jgi:predicted CopG family antitoxin